MRTYDPFRELETLRREIDRAFSSTLSNRGDGFATAFLPGRAARAYPLLNLSEDKDNLYVQALAPGLAPEGLNVTLERNSLTISGEKPAPQGVKLETFHRNERAAGKFVRTIELPVEVDSDRIQASYQDGLLTITLPRSAAARARQIAVSVQ